MRRRVDGDTPSASVGKFARRLEGIQIEYQDASANNLFTPTELGPQIEANSHRF